MRIANRHRGGFNDRWTHDPQEAFLEAERRVQTAARHELTYRLSKFLRGDEEYELFLSDLSALDRIPPRIRTLRLIRELNLGYSFHEGRHYPGTKLADLSFISHLPYLRRLNISRLPVQDLSPLSSLIRLEKLDCSFCPVTDLSPISGLYDLRSLNISGTPVAKLDAVAKLPAFKRGNELDLKFYDTPALRDDPSLGLLMRVKDIKNDEIFLYVEGRHPAFAHSSPPLSDSIIDKLSDASVVKFESLEGKISSFNQNPENSARAEKRQALIEALRFHIKSLVMEAETRQIPQFMIARIKRYEQQVDRDHPLFIMLDAPMSFLKGSLRDQYTLDGLDKGFIMGLRKLIQIHKELEKAFTVAVAESLNRPLKEGVTADDLNRVSDNIEEAVSHTSVREDLSGSTLETIYALRDYVAAAARDGRTGGSALKLGVSAFITTLAALASAATIHLWAKAETGAAFLAKIKELITMLWNFFV